MGPLKRIPFDDVHRHEKARMTDFAGWDLPVWYTSIGNDIEIMIRDKLVIAHIVSRKFYKRGERDEPQGI